MNTLIYEVDGRIARITLDRPERGNGITLEMPRELSECVERADLDPNVHVIALAGNGKGFCGGYDLVESAEGGFARGGPEGSPLDPMKIAANHDPSDTWDPVVRGGTGATCDWGLAARASSKARVILAGGLDRCNVGRAMAEVRPFGIDISSGVETGPGIKNYDLMRDFAHEVRDHESSCTQERGGRPC